MDDTSRLTARPTNPNLVSTQYNISPLQTMLDNKEFSRIIGDSSLFWQAFCYHLHQQNLNWDKTYTKLEGTTLSFTAKPRLIASFQTTLEKIRKILLKENSPVIMMQHTNVGPITQIRIYQQKPPETCTKACDIITLCMKRGLLESLGMKTSLSMSQAKIPNTNTFSPSPIDRLYQTKIYDQSHLTPVKIRRKPDFNALYNNSWIPRDITFIAKDGSEIKMHSSVLALCGGDNLPQLLKRVKDERHEMKITFTQFSTTTMQAFVDFLYFGEEKLQKKDIHEKQIDLGELIAFAHMYQIPGLLDHCINILQISATFKDVQSIQSMADTYKHPRLYEIYEHLHPMPHKRLEIRDSLPFLEYLLSKKPPSNPKDGT